MLGIKEVEVAKSVDDFFTSRSMEGAYVLEFDMLDSNIVLFEEDRLQSVLQMENECGRAKNPSTSKLSLKEADCSHDPRTFLSYWRS